MSEWSDGRERKDGYRGNALSIAIGNYFSARFDSEREMLRRVDAQLKAERERLSSASTTLKASAASAK